MKLLHLGDLHLGKRVCELSMLADQRYILEQVLDIVRAQNVDAVLIAGDVYDRPAPPPEAVSLLDDFLTALEALSVSCLMIPGNHDSGERLAFGARLLGGAGVHIAPVYAGAVHTVTLADAFGKVQFTLLPFMRPSQVRRYYPAVAPGDYEGALRAVLQDVPLAQDARHVLLAHQFVTKGGWTPARCDSESAAIGTLDHVDVSLFDAFDYVALGHIHGPQRVGRDAVRYAGSPLKYSFSEVNHRKSAPLVTLGRKGEVDITLCPLVPLRDLRAIRGPLDRLLDPAVFAGTDTADYMHITLTDDAVMDAMNKVRAVYPNTLRLDFAHALHALADAPVLDSQPAQGDPLKLFDAFYAQQNGEAMDEDMRGVVKNLFAEKGGDAQ